MTLKHRLFSRLLAPGVVMLAISFMAHAQPFDNGSDGSYGAMNITVDTELPLPPDGIFQVTTMTVASGATLTFTRNALNTPVRILAQGDVIIQGSVDVSYHR